MLSLHSQIGFQLGSDPTNRILFAPRVSPEPHLDDVAWVVRSDGVAVVLFSCGRR